MKLPFHLGLRNQRHMVSIFRVNNQHWLTLGQAFSKESHRREQILSQWGINGFSPRYQSPEKVHVPFTTRHQHILSYQLDTLLQHQLQPGTTSPIANRQQLIPGLQHRAHLGSGHAVLPVRQQTLSSSVNDSASTQRAQHSTSSGAH
ncbi:hypothetical protein KCM76_17930 [Zooshikella marina]|uniref:hypothetical protein n=1 Tax=Zooshikella ganghwensis TaxID=202772 RepID=UPI001BAF739E|nr:hypothetical protein [Zooshikella ganghwensis]MBU2707879.1 hypothetical protein [Zooshikella ganghwensis]